MIFRVLPVLRVNTGLSRQLLEHDRHGEPIYPENSAPLNVCVTNELVLPSGKLSFNVIAKIAKAQAPKYAFYCSTLSKTQIEVVLDQ
ncbi:hypothetical protein [Polaromonas jejuensis]|uniref:Uncharacterized protein n=1 Tax=Polaromonas jejuensis TaxID=457502 RepID=A0ABW0QBZ4_9BURK|nr:hypothetical protein [Polaromonas jejuensis]